jgi:serine protease
MPGFRTSMLAAAAVLCALAGCGRRTVDRSLQAELNDPDVVPGLIDVQLRGVEPAHKQLVQGLGKILEAEELRDESLEGLFDRDVAEHFMIKVDPDKAAAVLAALRAHGDVLYAEPVVRMAALWTPNDPDFSKQWHLKAAGAPAAWEATRGAGVTVAVIDTGVAPVEDLDKSRLVAGHNFIANSADATDDHGHGTHVAGTIGQSTGNGVGVAGMAPKARLMPLKVLSAQGMGTSTAIADAIRYAADHGARVMNLSLGGGGHSAAMADAVAYARRRGALVVCAAGNSGSRGVSYPAAYPGALAVSAVGPRGTLAPYSSFGPEVRIAAPGGDKSLGEESGVLQQTLAEGDPSKSAYRWFQGTSMATPHVAGAAALVASLGVTSPAAIERALLGTTKTPPDGADKERYGAGLLDAAAAVRLVALWHGLLRLALAFFGAWFALAQARRLQQIRASERMPFAFWAALTVGAGALTALAPLGLARIPGSALVLTPLAGLGALVVGSPHASIAGSVAALVGFSAVVPFGLATFTRAAGFRRSTSLGTWAPLVAGLCFGWAGLLLQAALLRSVYLPWVPAALAPVWLLISAVIAWGAGRGLLAKESLR